MKKFYLIICLIAVSGMCYAQGEASDFTGNTSDRPRDPRADQMNFVPNEVLVKFKDDVVVSGGTTLKSAGISSVDRLLKASGVASLEKLFPTETKLKSVRIVKDPQGQDMKIPSLHNIYRITVPQLKSTGSAPADIFKLMEELKALPEVEYAEPNYIYSIDDLEPVGPILTADDVAKLQNENLKSDQSSVVPNDPLYSQQWYIPAVKADQVWEQTTGDTTQVIAILDTGVDWNHPDLKNKIWRNKAEIPDNGIDDDGNGLVDDIRGWDYINNDNNPMDDNSHGTHVAGIAAAESNNGIGIAGVNWKAKIMPLKVFNHSGTSDVATIVQGINYAVFKGATVINMSFGSFARSLTMESALQNAYVSSVLVAAAGNSSLCIGPNVCSDSRPGLVAFPAGLPYVLGVQANENYSNYDPDGPVFSEYSEGYNYELLAPGTALSTTPSGNYRVLSGTSMACPIIAGVAALYKELYPENSSEKLWGDFVHSSNGLFDSNKACFPGTRNPILDLMEYSLADTLGTDDRDNQPDAGETISLGIKVRNTSGSSDSTYVFLRNNLNGDPGDITLLKHTAFIGSISTYATKTNQFKPLTFFINSNTKNGKSIPIDIVMKNGKTGQEFIQTIYFKIYRGEELSGLLSRDTILTADKQWLINSSLRIGAGVKMTLQPGTHLQINGGVDNRGYIEAIGNENNRIKIEGPLSGNFTIKYVDLDLRMNSFSGNAIHCNFENGNGIGYGSFFNCSFTNFLEFNISSGTISGAFNNCLFENFNAGSLNGSSFQSVFENLYTGDPGYNTFVSSYSVFNKIINFTKIQAPWNPFAWSHFPGFLFYISSGNEKIHKNSLISNDETSYFVNTSGSSDAISLSNQYWGTTDSLKIRKKYTDFWNDASRPFFFYKPLLIEPSDSCHAHVWKILVNGKDAQDELVDPVGVGKQRFDVYFNRPMDKTKIPQISFGVKPPYNQQSINQNGFWSEDGKIYTVYKNISLATGDGLNRIRVAGAKEVNGWEWEIPVEDMRFEFVISAANSASMDFLATPSLGKVKLEWNNNDLADGLGFNMYRMEHINDSVLTKPVLVNKTLIADTLFTDFAVTPNKKYYYYYKILRTNLTETDSSKVVSAIPFTAAKGDANGDLFVNVLDITTIVAYLLNNNPQPFILEAADLNSDGNINVLDIVGVVNLVLGNKSAVIATSEQVKLYMQNDTLFADAPVAVGGIQFDISGATSVEEIQKLKVLEGFESGYSASEKGVRLLYYSLSGKSIPAGNRIPLLRLIKGSGVSDAIFADKIGISIPVNYDVTGVWNLSDKLNETVAELGQNFPNPLNLQTTIPIHIYEPVDEAVIRIVNMFGQTVDAIHLSNPTVGEHLVQWNSGAQRGFFAYLLEIRRGKQQFICPVRKMIVQ